MRKPVFTGDSYYTYDINPEIKAHKGPINQRDKAPLPATLAHSKMIDNAGSAIETQPVNTGDMAEGLTRPTQGDRVDMKKVRDIRWVLKRRYLKSRNFQRIFNYWDMEHKGSVSAQNMYDMCKRLGINANPRECEVVIATADRKGNGLLGPDEFLDLIYNHIVLDIDTTAAKQANIIDGPDVEQLKKSLNEQARKSRDQKHYNQVKFVLRSHLKDLQRDFARTDVEGNLMINHYNFEKVLKVMNISERVMDDNDIERLFKTYAKEANKINYKEFVEDIQNTMFEIENIYRGKTGINIRATDFFEAREEASDYSCRHKERGAFRQKTQRYRRN
jgi:Ca2+-binding EF-hand superfamily protein